MSPSPAISQPRPPRLARATQKQYCETQFGGHAGKPILLWIPFKTGRLFKCISLLALTATLPLNLAPAPNAVSPRLSADTLHSLLQQALDAFAQNDFATAASFFHRIDREFSSEPEFRNPEFPRRMLPIRGRAELASGQPA